MLAASPPRRRSPETTRPQAQGLGVRNPRLVAISAIRVSDTRGVYQHVHQLSMIGTVPLTYKLDGQISRAINDAASSARLVYAQRNSGSEVGSTTLSQFDHHGVSSAVTECHVTSFGLRVGCTYHFDRIVCVGPYVKKSRRIPRRLLRNETFRMFRTAILEPL